MAAGGDSSPRLVARLGGSLRARLALLVAVLVLAGAVASALLVIDAARGHRATTERQLYGTARALSLATDGEVAKLEAVLRTLAASPDLSRGDIAAFERQARAVGLSKDAWFVLTDDKGRQLVNTRLSAGAPLPAIPSADFNDRWQAVLRQGTTISNLGQGRIYKGRIVAVNMLVRQDGRPAYSLSAVAKPSLLQAVYDKQGLVAGWYGVLIDRNFVLMARNVDPAHTVGRSAKPDMIARIRSSGAGVFQSVSLDGKKTLAAYHRSDFTGWTTVVAMPRAEGLGYLNRNLLLTLGASAALLAGGAAVAYLLGRRVTRAMEQLGAAASDLGRGRAVALPTAGIAEVDAVAVALTRAGGDLAAREGELRELNETLEARVQEQSEKLVQAQKLEALGRLTGGVAHDFNNLLTAVLGNLDMLAKRVTEPRQVRYLANAAEAAQKGARLTAQLLAFARKQRLTPEPVEVNALIEGMNDLLAGAVGDRVRIERRLAPLAGQAMADRTQLELIVLNLAINARDAMPSGGVLRIETARRAVTRTPASEGDPAPGDYVVVSVSDTGEGMTAEVLRRVFEPFFTTKAVGHGSGLGLPQILGITKQLGGGVQIDSHPGEGATVQVFLPPALAAPVIAEPPRLTDAGLLRGRTILVIDDDGAVRDVAAGLLAELGLKPVTARSGAEALARLEGEADGEPRIDIRGIDLALIDFAMPGVDGAETAERLRGARADLPVVLMTGYADGEALGGRWTGPLLPKPFTADTLATELTRAAGL